MGATLTRSEQAASCPTWPLFREYREMVAKHLGRVGYVDAKECPHHSEEFMALVRAVAAGKQRRKESV